MIDSSSIEIIKTIGTISTPIILILLSSIGWKLRKKLEREVEIENKLRTDRIGIYEDILEPFIIILTNNSSQSKEKKSIEIINSLDYRKKAFQLFFTGDDYVLKSFNNLMQYFYNHEKPDPAKIMSLFGTLLLDIRKSTGNEKTKLNKFEMLEWLIKDIKELKDKT